MTKHSRQQGRRKKSSPLSRGITWAAVLAGIALLVYGATHFSGVPYGEAAIAVVNFSSLDSGQKRKALQAANQARCTCSCGMTLAQCVATDSTCPVRESNIDRIRALVREAERDTR